jgi:hypothetical protein
VFTAVNGKFHRDQMLLATSHLLYGIAGNLLESRNMVWIIVVLIVIHLRDSKTFS